MKKVQIIKIVLTTLVLTGCFLYPTAAALGDWNVDPVKWDHIQLPDLSPFGMDVKAGDIVMPIPGPQLITERLKVLADDFECSTPGPILDIHIWGSWKDDNYPSAELDPDNTPLNPDPGLTSFTLGIWSDIPADANGNPFSRPDQLLWQRTFLPGQFSVRDAGTGDEDWYDPNEQEWIDNNHQKAYQYNFLIPEPEAFVQEGTLNNPIVYWLSVSASPQGAMPGTNGVTPDIDNGFPPVGTLFFPPEFGWKTTDPANNWNDDAVYSDWFWDGSGTSREGDGQWSMLLPEGDWLDMTYPPGHPFHPQSVNMAFVITPEPTTLMMLGLGAAALIRRRRQLI